MKRFSFLVAILLFIAACSSEQIKYTVTEDGIDIKATAWGRFIPKDSLLTDRLKITTVREIRPVIRLGGIGQPPVEIAGYKIDQYAEGWFGLESGEIALIFHSEHSHVVYIPTTMRTPRYVMALADYTAKLPIGTTEVGSDTYALVLGTDEPGELVNGMIVKWEIDPH